jgi:hypothetical protein
MTRPLELARHVDGYLAIREAVGLTNTRHERGLRDFIAYARNVGAADGSPIRAATAVAWAWDHAPATCGIRGRSDRLIVVRGFLNYLAEIIPGTEVPGSRVIAAGRRRRPYLFSDETLPEDEVFNGGKAMDAVKSDKSAPATGARVVENERRDLARPKAPSMVDGGGPGGDVLQAGARSIAEIEKLMGELHTARDYLQSEGERLRRDTARYAHLTQSALSSVKMISESMEKWRETDLPVPG